MRLSAAISLRRTLGSVILVAGLAALPGLAPQATLLAATVDVEDLSGRARPRAQDPMTLPNLNESLDPTAKQQLAAALLSLGSGDFAKAELAARRLTVSNPDAPEAWYTLGLSLANLDRKDEALVALDEAAKRYTQNAEPLVIKGDLLLSMGYPQEAAAAWDQAATRDPANFRAQERLAAVLESKGDLEAALARYRLSIDHDFGNRLYPKVEAARLSLLLNRPVEAEALLEDKAQAEDAPDEVLDYLARAKAGLDKTEEARTLFTRLADRGTSPRALIALSRLALAESDIGQAEIKLRDAAAAFPDHPSVLAEQGKLMGATGKYLEALNIFESGLAKDPADPELLRNASLAAARLGQMDRAVAHAKALCARKTATTDDQIWLASLYEAANAPDDAVKTYRTVLESDPVNFIALNNLGSLLTGSAPEEALSLAQKAAEQMPANASVQDTLGWAQMKSGRIEDASTTFETIRTNNPTSAQAAYRLGLVRLEQGKAQEGRALLKEALQLDPDFRYAEDAKERLQ